MPAWRIASLIAALAVSTAAEASVAATQAWVEMGPAGSAVVRALVDAPACPGLEADGRKLAMSERAAPTTMPLRPTASSPDLSKPSIFASRVCEAALPPGTRRARVAGVGLPPLPPREVRRIVVIGDTGCRLKASSAAYQACNDPAHYPFAEVAASAARVHPDLVLDVGDYLYRENPCPAGNAGCAGSPWGYGEDAWEADFLAPAAPLLAAAPWAMVRGNHETCDRAGQGWERFFAPGPLVPRHACLDPADDALGNHDAPFATSLGATSQIVVWDSSAAPGKTDAALDDPKVAPFVATARAVDALAAAKPHTFLADHHPLLAFAAKRRKDGTIKLLPGDPGLQAAFTSLDPALVPTEVELLLSGHVHVEEALDFQDGARPAQLVTGFSGTEEDTVPLPPTLADADEPAPGVPVRDFSSWVDGFGFAVLDRMGEDRWRVSIRNSSGREVNACELNGRRLRCTIAQVTAH